MTEAETDSEFLETGHNNCNLRCMHSPKDHSINSTSDELRGVTQKSLNLSNFCDVD